MRTGDNYELIIFDCDGVLVDSEVLAVQVESALLAEVGIELTPLELTEQYVGLSYSSMIRDLEKPEPDLFLLAAADMGVSPDRCLVIEDSAHGVTAAVRAGMDVVGLLAAGHATPSLGQRLDAAGASSVFSSYPELASALEIQRPTIT